MSFGGFSDITRDNDRAYSAGYKSLNRNGKDLENSGRSYDNGLSSGRYRQRQDEERDSNNRRGGDSEQQESYGREERDRDEGGGGGLGRGYSGDKNNERRTRLNDDNDGVEYNHNSSQDRDKDGTRSQSHEYGNQEHEGAGRYSRGCGDQGPEGTSSYSRGTYGGQNSERGGCLSGGAPSRILKSGVLAGIETFGKAYEMSSSLNQERDGGPSYQNSNNRVENSAFGDRVKNQESEIKKGGEAIGSVFNAVKNGLGSGIENFTKKE